VNYAAHVRQNTPLLRPGTDHLVTQHSCTIGMYRQFRYLPRKAETA
jgi:hypothetical protein